MTSLESDVDWEFFPTLSSQTKQRAGMQADTHRTGIASNLHGAQLEPGPVEVQLCGPASGHIGAQWVSEGLHTKH